MLLFLQPRWAHRSRLCRLLLTLRTKPQRSLKVVVTSQQANAQTYRELLSTMQILMRMDGHIDHGRGGGIAKRLLAYI